MPIDKDDDTDETDKCEEVSTSVAEIIEEVDSSIAKLDAIEQDGLRLRYRKRLDKAKDKLEVAKKSLDDLVTLLGQG